MKRLVLVGGGHAHLHVLKSMAGKRWPEAQVTLISPHTRQVYSGMLPGWMAGHYTLAQCAAELAPLVAASGARFIEDQVVGIDAERCVVTTRTGEAVAYDVLSLASGARVDHACLQATGATLLPVRPLESFITGWSDFLARASAHGQTRLAVVGGGAAGVELALAARYRLTMALGGRRADVALVVGQGLLPGHGSRVVRRVQRELALAGVRVVNGYALGQADGPASGLRLGDGSTLAADCIIPAIGVTPPAFLEHSRLALAEDGFVAVHDGQQSVSHANVFAGGDVASRVDCPHPKSGVYAVRAGPILAVNLARALRGESPLSYRPQRRSLYLLATGPRRAIASWSGLSAQGRWAWRWKDWIDRRFMAQYDRLSSSHKDSCHDPVR